MERMNTGSLFDTEDKCMCAVKEKVSNGHRAFCVQTYAKEMK